MSMRFVLNETSYFGKGAREELAGEIKKRGFEKVFLVSDKSLVDAGVTAKVEEILEKADIPYTLYSEIKPNPTIENVLDGVEACKNAKAKQTIKGIAKIRLQSSNNKLVFDGRNNGI